MIAPDGSENRNNICLLFDFGNFLLFCDRIICRHMIGWPRTHDPLASVPSQLLLALCIIDTCHHTQRKL